MESVLARTWRAHLSTGRRAPAVERALWISVAAVLPAIALGYLLVLVASGGVDLVDYRSFHNAASSILRGESPYPDYVYPPLTAVVTTPLALLPLWAAEIVVVCALVVAVWGTLRLLGVDDWRCYGVAFLWPSVLSAIQTGNITILLGLGAALAWRFRESPRWSALALGSTLAAKFFLWPLVIWLAATRRSGAAIGAVLAGGLVLVASWAVIGFAGVREYVDILRGVQQVVENDAYTVNVVARDVGFAPEVARLIWLAAGLGLLITIGLVGRRGDDRRAFQLGIAAALLLSPIVWLHYFELLLVVVAVARPRLSLVWFVPFVMYLTPGSGDPTPFQTAVTLAAAALTVGLALRGREPAMTASRRREKESSEPQGDR